MQMCQPHWDKLRAAIDERGLSALVARDGRAAAERVKREIEGTDGPDDFDPLMSSMWAIFNNATATIEGHAPSPEEGARAALSFMAADICPLCELNALHERDCREEDCTFSYDGWIGRAADDAAAYASTISTAGAAPREGAADGL